MKPKLSLLASVLSLIGLQPGGSARMTPAPIEPPTPPQPRITPREQFPEWWRRAAASRERRRKNPFRGIAQPYAGETERRHAGMSPDRSRRHNEQAREDAILAFIAKHERNQS